MRTLRYSGFSGFEAGISLIETVVVLAILGTVAVIFLTGLTISTKAAFITDERATSESLARSQMEWAQAASWSTTGYTTASIPSGTDYSNYSANITAGSMPGGDADIQKITVTVTHSDTTVITLESYKVNR